MEELIIKQGMWKECLDYAIKAKAHYSLYSLLPEETSKNNISEVKRWDKVLRSQLVGLSIKYKCDICLLSTLIYHLVEIMQLIPSEKLEMYNPVGKIYRPTEFQKWISEEKYNKV